LTSGSASSEAANRAVKGSCISPSTKLTTRAVCRASIRTVVPEVGHGPSNVTSFGAPRVPWITVSLKVSPSADTDRHSTRSAMP
jgi:hypothetical protein